MRSLGLLTALLLAGTACQAHAQTLNEQMQRLQGTQSPSVAAPANWPSNATGATTQTQPAPAAQAPAPAPVAAQPAAMTAPAMTAPAMMAPAAAPVTSNVIDSVGGGAIPALPLEIMTSGGVVFVSGGIGDEELEMLKSREHEFNVKILLSAGKGEYVSGVALRILDFKDVPLVGISDAGPYVYAKMQPGVYSVETTSAGGVVKKDKLTVTDKGMVKKHYTFSE